MMIYLQNPKGLFSSHQKRCLSAHPYDHRKKNAYQESFPQLQKHNNPSIPKHMQLEIN